MIYFDSEINNPIKDARNILLKNIDKLVSVHAPRKNKDFSYFENQVLTVFEERIIQKKTLREVADMLNLKAFDRIRQIEYQIIFYLRKKMKEMYNTRFSKVRYA